jgi:signal transduction histidine kinase
LEVEKKRNLARFCAGAIATAVSLTALFNVVFFYYTIPAELGENVFHHFIFLNILIVFLSLPAGNIIGSRISKAVTNLKKLLKYGNGKTNENTQLSTHFSETFEVSEAIRNLKIHFFSEIRKLAEDKFKAESAAESKTEFLNRISHEIRTPLNAVIGFSDMLHKQLKDTQNYMARQIFESGKKQLDMINEIIEYSKLDSGKISLYKEEINIETAISDCINEIKEKYNYKGDIKFRPTGNVSGYMVDIQKFREMIKHLLSNSIKYSKVPNVSVSATSENIKEKRFLTVSVEDRGNGISEKDLEEILKHPGPCFGKEATARTITNEGLGLGLIIVKKLAELHGGWFSVENGIAGQGIFKIYFPEGDN